MEVKLNSNLGPVGNVSATNQNLPATRLPQDRTSFESAAVLEKKLADVPEVRPEAVARARDLIASTNYPPPETIDKIAALLATQFGKL